jgi:hypothetical protein
MYVLDGTSERTDYQAMHAAGVVGVIRYLSTTPWKNISKGEYDRTKAAGFDVALVWETTANMTDGGHAAGILDGVRATQQADALGYPTAHFIYWAVDHDPSPASIAAAVEYGKGFAQSSSYLTRPYGNDHLVDGVVAAGVADKGWQCRAWSGSPVRHSASAVLFQRTDDPLHLGGSGYDVNDVLGVDWAARSIAPAPPSPHVGESEMVTVRNNDGSFEGFRCVNGQIEHQWITRTNGDSAWVPLANNPGVFIEVGSAEFEGGHLVVTALGAGYGTSAPVQFATVRTPDNKWTDWAPLSAWVKL